MLPQISVLAEIVRAYGDWFRLSRSFLERLVVRQTNGKVYANKRNYLQYILDVMVDRSSRHWCLDPLRIEYFPRRIFTWSAAACEIPHAAGNVNLEDVVYSIGSDRMNLIFIISSGACSSASSLDGWRSFRDLWIFIRIFILYINMTFVKVISIPHSSRLTRNPPWLTTDLLSAAKFCSRLFAAMKRRHVRLSIEWIGEVLFFDTTRRIEAMNTFQRHQSGT